MILEIDNIELSFDLKQILRGVYIHAESGKVTGILGRNGSGKTSLLNILFGCLQPKYKSIRVDGKFMKRPLYQQNQIAYLPQHKLLSENLKIITYFKLFHVDWDEFIHKFMHFEKLQNQPTNELSGGERRLLETYLVLNSNKNIILLDEPFSNLAPIYVSSIKELIDRKKANKIILITDHMYEEIVDLCDQLYFLKNGCSKLIDGKENLIKEGYLPSNSPQM
ncbi:ATP-binding cassette domain-containing protein [Allomuricauda sp. NBRC 101325]|uniref:ATP-binding cassette domain-containing protein n=1 Tax=Allomuricauda sp. NBRC 101325 TaxID=1113758 RepID=UPI0024A56E54|nr:ATP-binding cassette domain-containing protein [Muricauda sp. NBRC 101325]GLU44049.1 ABC transporter ATP-binding protein [Muricauda sp. NBRC 101325]